MRPFLPMLRVPMACLLFPCTSGATEAPAPLAVVSHHAPAAAKGMPANYGMFTYQGELVDAGQPVDGTVSLRFDFGSTSPPQVLGTSVVTDVPVVDGRFTTQVPVPYPIDSATTTLAVAVERVPDPDFVPLGAQPLSPTPLAMYAERAGTAGFALAPWEFLGGIGIAYTGGRVGIDTQAPVGKLHVQGGADDEVSLYGNGGVPMLHFRNDGNSRDWVFRHDGSNFHLQREVSVGNESMTWAVNGNVGIGETAPGARLDIATGASTAPLLRVRQTLAGASNPTGVRIEVAGSGSGGTSGTALQAHATATSGDTIGVSARSDSSDGLASFAYATAGSGQSTGLLARNNSSSGTAVDAWAAAGSGTPIALRARVDAPNGIAARFEGGITQVNGRLAVGTSSPVAPLHVSTGSGTPVLRADINASPRLQLHDNGGLSIGSATLPPVNGLHVTGAIQQTAQTRWVSITGKAFVSERSGAAEVASHLLDGLAVSGPGGNAVYFSAPLQLPHGATITQLRALVTDLANVPNITVQIVRRAHADAGFGVLASTASSNATLAQQTLVDDSISGALVDNETYAYDLRAFWEIPSVGNDEDIRLNTVRVAYIATAPW
jgi:hypothetical protein